MSEATHDELIEIIKVLQEQVNDLRWRMNSVCNYLSMKDKKEKKECEHESDFNLYYHMPVGDEQHIWLPVTFPLPGTAVFMRKEWHLTHEDCHTKCKLCGEFYR